MSVCCPCLFGSSRQRKATSSSGPGDTDIMPNDTHTAAIAIPGLIMSRDSISQVEEDEEEGTSVLEFIPMPPTLTTTSTAAAGHLYMSGNRRGEEDGNRDRDIDRDRDRDREKDHVEWSAVHSEACPGGGNGTRSELRVTLTHHDHGNTRDSASASGSNTRDTTAGVTVIMCWVGFDGSLHHYRRLQSQPTSGPAAESSGSAGAGRYYTEHSFTGHAFVFFLDNNTSSGSGSGSDSDSSRPVRLDDIRKEAFLCLYQLREEKAAAAACVEPECDQTEEEEEEVGAGRHVLALSLGLTAGTVTHPVTSTASCVCVSASASVVFERMQCEVGGAPITDEHVLYESRQISGFTVHSVAGVLAAGSDVLHCLQIDLAEARRLLPAPACRLLQHRTAIYVNETLIYGTSPSRKITGRHLCYHPSTGQDWLTRHGLRAAKAGCVEMSCVADYLATRGSWGTGGLLLHELAHAFHDHGCEGGYCCEEIRQAYSAAMAEDLYSAVAVKGCETLLRAYACTDPMEFFAELSVAFLWGGRRLRRGRKRGRRSIGVNTESASKEEEEVEFDDPALAFNKWFPFNRQELKAHDRQSFDTLRRMWHHHSAITTAEDDDASKDNDDDDVSEDDVSEDNASYDNDDDVSDKASDDDGGR